MADKSCGCFHYNRDEKKTYFQSCDTCSHLEEIDSHFVCGIVKYFGGSYEKKKKEDENPLY